MNKLPFSLILLTKPCFIQGKSNLERNEVKLGLGLWSFIIRKEERFSCSSPLNRNQRVIIIYEMYSSQQ